MIIKSGLKIEQIEALLFRSQEALVTQNQFFSILNSEGPSGLLKRYLTKGALTLHKPAIREMNFEVMARQDYYTSNSLFFTFGPSSLPPINIEKWNFRIEGEGVDAPISINYNDLLKMPFKAITRYLECAHNGSSYFDLLMNKKTEGPQWHSGGFGIAEWMGVRLGDLLKKARVNNRACDVLIIGIDGEVNSRPIPISKALDEDSILAYIMNGQILALEHGFPLRAIVPGWIGAANIKWVTKIIVSTKPAKVINNTEKYTLIGPDYPSSQFAKGTSLTTQLIKSACCLPWPAVLPTGHNHIVGYAWSPFGKIASADISIDGGKAFTQAVLKGPNIEAAGTRWEYHFDAKPGEISIMPKATDDKGNTQYGISEQKWNQQGYLFGAMVPHPVTVTDECCQIARIHGDYSMVIPATGGCC